VVAAVLALVPARVSVAAARWSLPSGTTADAHVLGLAMDAAACAVKAGDVADPSTLVVIDYSRPSTDRRLWLFDLRTGSLVLNTLVAHGQGSGGNDAVRFSNEAETHESSLGLFVARDTNTGKNGYSLRLDGLEPGINDRARERAIVMHGAPYVSDTFAKAQGRIGRSWGCPALPLDVARAIIDRVKGGSVVFAYYPDTRWLNSSKYLGGCSRAR